MTDDCEWSQITKLNDPWDMFCGSDTYFDRDSDLAGNALITGIKSFYDHDAKDRKWKIKCCKVSIKFVDNFFCLLRRKLSYCSFYLVIGPVWDSAIKGS